MEFMWIFMGLIFGGITMVVARNNGRSAGTWFVIGLRIRSGSSRLSDAIDSLLESETKHHKHRPHPNRNSADAAHRSWVGSRSRA